MRFALPENDRIDHSLSPVFTLSRQNPQANRAHTDKITIKTRFRRYPFMTVVKVSCVIE